MLKRLIVYLLIVAVMLPLLAKAILWYSVDRELERIKDEFSDTGLFEWRSVSSTLAGKVKIHDVDLVFFDARTSLHVAEINLAFDDTLSLFFSLPGLLSGQWPYALAFNAEDAQISLSGNTEALSPTNESAGVKKQSWLPLSLPNCSKTRDRRQSFINKTMVYQVGYEKMTMSGALSYQSQGGLSYLFSGKVDVQDAGSIRFTGRAQKFTDYALRLKDINIEAKDLGFFRRIGDYCGKLSGKEQGAYLVQLVKSWTADFSRIGVRLTPAFARALRNFMALGDELSIHYSSNSSGANPLVSSPEVLARTISDAEIQFLNDQGSETEVFVAIDRRKLKRFFANSGLLIPATSIRKAKSTERVAEPLRKPSVHLPSERADPSPVDQAAVGRNWRSGYHAVATPYLSELLGAPVKLVLTDGKMYEGNLQAASVDSISVAKVVDLKGEVAYTFRLAEIADLKVWMDRPTANRILNQMAQDQAVEAVDTQGSEAEEPPGTTTTTFEDQGEVRFLPAKEERTPIAPVLPRTREGIVPEEQNVNAEQVIDSERDIPLPVKSVNLGKASNSLSDPTDRQAAQTQSKQPVEGETVAR